MRLFCHLTCIPRQELARIAGGATGEIQLQVLQRNDAQRQNESQSQSQATAKGRGREFDHDDEEIDALQTEESCLCNGFSFFVGDRRRKAGGAAYTGID